MFAQVETILNRADLGCQLWPHEVANATATIVNTLYFLDLDFFAQREAERAREAIVAYARSRCLSELAKLAARDEDLREAAYIGLDRLRVLVQSAQVNTKARSLMTA
jgi:hypothetical protein